ncbi:selenocysteine-specific translation elongation factor [Luteipulveratus halotolerans]|uniref:Translation elongation factor n=1 Tax=Luteipulveratus halotolerans TaxID=1631356 RepID=A0A0L6CMP8_9MICO|nr:selenocysteine-specific translation elongation factor [Luteipulveratus halotolerans]KNX38828.1 translation elongation factor [Luteipulveratus halotolerans]
MTSYVVATAGHVDHGKSTLVRALTGMEPDRWEEERRRGLTIDLGFAWTTLPSGRDVAFVDVPGHERFLGNMLAGLGPAPVVLFVVAADEGWQAQSSDHRDAVAALGIEHGLVVITRADRVADDGASALAQARVELAETGLRDAAAVVVSAVAGAGLDDLRSALDRVLASLPTVSATGRVRLWVDRAFTITGSGTVLTGTLTGGTLAVGERLDVLGADGPTPLTVRGLQSRGSAYPSLGPTSRVGLNVRGVAADDVHRGDALVTPDAWPVTLVVDVRRVAGFTWNDAPEHLTVHVGTAAVPARLRPFGDDHGRLTLDRALPLVLGDRLVLMDPGRRAVVGGALVLDADPPALTRRGDGVRRTTALADLRPEGDVLAEVARRGVVEVTTLSRLGLATDVCPADVIAVDGWWAHRPAYDAWAARLHTALDRLHTDDPLAPGLSRGAVRDLLGLPSDAFVDALVRDGGLEQEGGHVRLPGRAGGLGAASSAVAAVESRLRDEPFAAPEADDLTSLGLGARELAAAERLGRLLRLDGGVVLLPNAPALAMRTLATLPQPFTTSGARQALGTTRRVVIPLLEHLDGRGWTRRIDAGHREIVR